MYQISLTAFFNVLSILRVRACVCACAHVRARARKRGKQREKRGEVRWPAGCCAHYWRHVDQCG